MPCSTCATNVLQRFLGGFEIFVSKTAGRPPTRHFYSTGARQFYNARSTPRRTSKNPRYVEPSEHLDLKILRQTSTPPLEPALAKEEEQEETDEDSHRVEVADAVDEHGQRAKSEQQQTHRKDSNSLDRSWWEEHYSSDLRKSNRTPSQPGASSPPSASHPRTRSPSTPTTTKNAPSSPSEPTPSNPPKPRTGPSPWQIQKAALATKFPTGWIPRKRLSPDTLDGIRTLHAQYPLKYTTPVLASQFKVSPEAIRRILKSKWRPSDEEEEERVKRWENRGKSIWEGMAEVGLKPPRKWREMGVRKKVGVGRGEARRCGENRGERRRREREGESGADGGRGEGVGERGGQARGKSKDVATAFTLKSIPAREAVRPGLGYQVPLADRIL